MNNNMSSTKMVVAAACLFAALAPAQAEDKEPAATPYRPSVATPAQLSEPGWLELELGWQRIHGGSDSRRDSLPLTAKLAFSEDWGVRVSTEAGIRRTDLDNNFFTGMGDTTVVLKHLIGGESEKDGAWGIEAGVKTPTAKDNLGSGKSDYQVNMIYSVDRLGNHLDLNLNGTRIGAIGEGEGRTQYGWAAALSRALDDNWTIFGELSGAYRRATPVTSQLLAGASYNVSKRVVVDAGMARGLSSAAQDWTAFAGVTVLTAQLW
jgi:opacity protein-like surface antigen